MEDLQAIVKWARLLQQRTAIMLTSRFQTGPRSLLWAASLFDRRTWPHGDMQFDVDGNVKAKLEALCKDFPIARVYPIKLDEFVSAARLGVTLLVPS